MNRDTALSLDRFKKKLPEFCKWAETNGAELLKPTNEWEVARFMTDAGIGVIYKNRFGRLNFQGSAQQAVDAFLSGKSWRASKPGTRPKKTSVVVRTLLERDGDLCFFCQTRMSDDNTTVEHLVAVTHGGPNHVSNYVLAHRKCNADVGHMSAMSKIKLHIAAALRAETHQ